MVLKLRFVNVPINERDDDDDDDEHDESFLSVFSRLIMASMPW